MKHNLAPTNRWHLSAALSISLSLISLLANSARAADRPDILIADFEATNYGAWRAVGEAFGPGPARGTLPNQMKVDGFLGQGLVNSFFGGDRSTGSLTSPPFKIERQHIQFLIGGGKNPGKTCMNLLLDGKAVRTATGPNDKAGGSEHLDWQAWDVADLAGKTVSLEIVDQATGGWGHINVDQILQTDRRLPVLLSNAQRKLKAQARYLNLPVKNGAPKRRLSLLVDGHAEREFEIELANAEPDFWAFLDLTPFIGKDVVVNVDSLPEDSRGLESIEQGSQIKGAENLYHEKLRPQFHFSSRRGWNNDPNGLVYSKGEYHLFYQHNPFGWDWGNMHWGHAVSSDLVHWKELPTALYPRRFGDWAFSGSAVVDKQNTAGWKTGGEEVLVAAFTSTGRGECITYSNDRGRSWHEFTGNPVVKHNGRDPKLLWHAPTSKWVMCVYDEIGKTQNIAFYTSPDLKTWEFQSRIEGFFECPDMFELPVDPPREASGAAPPKPRTSKWVLTAGNSDYMLGQFAGKRFTPETPKLPGHRGRGFYAAQTYSDIPAADGRRIQIGWGQMPSPGMPFNQMMTFPCELTLRTTPDGVRLCFEPVKEINSLRSEAISFPPQTVPSGDNPLLALTGERVEIRAEFDMASAAAIVLNIRGIEIVLDGRELRCKDLKMPLRPVEGKVRVQILVDRTSIEIFANDGLGYMPLPAIPKDNDRQLAVFARGGAAKLIALEAFELRSAWE